MRPEVQDGFNEVLEQKDDQILVMRRWMVNGPNSLSHYQSKSPGSPKMFAPSELSDVGQTFVQFVQ